MEDSISGEPLVLLAAAAAIQISQGRTIDELDLLSAFFDCLADNLALIAIQRPNEAANA